MATADADGDVGHEDAEDGNEACDDGDRGGHPVDGTGDGAPANDE